jgi:acyl-CoA thioester hydrolase
VVTIPLPTYDQVLELPAVIKRSVPQEYLDENDHMNIGRYLEVASYALWESTATIGMGPAYIEERNLSSFTAEHHLRYFSELRLGEDFSAHVRLIERSDKVLHSITFLLDRSRQALSFTCEATLLHIDMSTRRPTPYPDDIATGLDQLIAEHAAVTWPAPVSGAMGVRRR